MCLDTFDINDYINGSDDYMSEILGDYFTNDDIKIPDINDVQYYDDLSFSLNSELEDMFSIQASNKTSKSPTRSTAQAKKVVQNKRPAPTSKTRTVSMSSSSTKKKTTKRTPKKTKFSLPKAARYQKQKKSFTVKPTTKPPIKPKTTKLPTHHFHSATQNNIRSAGASTVSFTPISKRDKEDGNLIIGEVLYLGDFDPIPKKNNEDELNAKMQNIYEDDNILVLTIDAFEQLEENPDEDLLDIGPVQCPYCDKHMFECDENLYGPFCLAKARYFMNSKDHSFVTIPELDAKYNEAYHWMKSAERYWSNGYVDNQTTYAAPLCMVLGTYKALMYEATPMVAEEDSNSL